MTEQIDRSIPTELLNEVVERNLNGFSQWDSSDFEESEEIFKRQLTAIQKKEEKIGRAIHKGGAYYNLGLSLAFQGKMSDAISCFLYAYVEDALSTPMDEEYDADRGAAFHALRNYLGVKSNIILEINKKVLAIKKSGKWKEARDPNDILKQLAIELEISLSDMQNWVKILPTKFGRQSPFGFPERWEHRVFVGGAYRDKDSLLAQYKIKDAVRRKDMHYVPIMGSDAYIEEKYIHHHTLLLLHTCKWAIFEATIPAGQLMEIERTIDYENCVLVVYKLKDDQIRETVSSMLRTYSSPRIEFKEYKNLEELPNLVSNFLPEFEKAGTMECKGQ